jgi:glycosyltransferase involved in cell wall biosynthesis
MNVLMLSPYDAASHAYWRRGLVTHLDHAFTEVTLPARHFSWRFRGNSLTLSQDSRLDTDYDLIIATSMTDLSALRGMQPCIARTPAILYFHENQFDYPDDGNETHLLERRMTSIYAAVAAERLVFNSAYNRRSFLDGAADLLNKMPDHVPAGIVETLEAKSAIIPVALDGDCFEPGDKAGRFSIVWNHRWEHDKGLLELQQLVVSLLKSDLDFEFHLVGQQFRRTPPIMDETAQVLRESGRLGQVGFIESRDDYIALLRQCHCVISTARHDFQGLAVQEAMAAGCMPVVPDRLAYPEYVEDDGRYETIEHAVDLVWQASESYAAPDIGRLPSWTDSAPSWNQLIGSTID